MKRILALPILLVLIYVPCPAGTIVSTLSNEVLNGFWIGAYDYGPSADGAGSDDLEWMTVAQTFQTDRSYEEVTGKVTLVANGESLVTAGNQPLMASFYVAADDNGSPGPALASADVLITDPGPSRYQLAFQNLGLWNAGTYWLVASSTLIKYGQGSPNCCAGTLPEWNMSTASGGPMAYRRNDDPWVFQDASFAFAIEGSAGGDVSVPHPQAAPEPGSWLLLGCGILGMTLAGRRGSVKVMCCRAVPAPRIPGVSAAER